MHRTVRLLATTALSLSLIELAAAGAASAANIQIDTTAGTITVDGVASGGTLNGTPFTVKHEADGTVDFLFAGNLAIGASDVVTGSGANAAQIIVGNNLDIAPGARIDFSGVGKTPGAGGGGGAGAGGAGGGRNNGDGDSHYGYGGGGTAGYLDLNQCREVPQEPFFQLDGLKGGVPTCPGRRCRSREGGSRSERAAQPHRRRNRPAPLRQMRRGKARFHRSWKTIGGCGRHLTISTKRRPVSPRPAWKA